MNIATPPFLLFLYFVCLALGATNFLSLPAIKKTERGGEGVGMDGGSEEGRQERGVGFDKFYCTKEDKYASLVKVVDKLWRSRVFSLTYLAIPCFSLPRHGSRAHGRTKREPSYRSKPPPPPPPPDRTEREIQNLIPTLHLTDHIIALSHIGARGRKKRTEGREREEKIENAAKELPPPSLLFPLSIFLLFFFFPSEILFCTAAELACFPDN